MSLFPIASDKAQFSTAAVDAGDNYVNGVRINSADTACRAATTGGAQYSNGLLITNDGQVVIVDATAGLPANTQFVNGLPLTAAGALCVSTAAFSTYSNGIPFASNGAVSGDGISAGSFTTTLTYAASLPAGVPTPTNVANWNAAFGGTTYASVGVAGLVVTLTGPAGQVLLNNAGVRTAVPGLVSVVDTGAVSAIGNASFVNAPFEAATSLTTVTLPACTSVGENACLGSGLTGISLPACLTLGDSAFLQCAAVASVSLPACTSVGLNSLQECTSLTTLTLPSCLTVGNSGASLCTALTSVSLPVATFLDAVCLEGNTALTTISIPACTNLGGTTGNDFVFDLIAGNTITLTVKTATATDGDVLALQAANTVTLILV